MYACMCIYTYVYIYTYICTYPASLQTNILHIVCGSYYHFNNLLFNRPLTHNGVTIPMSGVALRIKGISEMKNC